MTATKTGGAAERRRGEAQERWHANVRAERPQFYGLTDAQMAEALRNLQETTWPTTPDGGIGWRLATRVALCEVAAERIEALRAEADAMRDQRDQMTAIVIAAVQQRQAEAAR